MRVRTVFNYGLGSPGLMTHYFADSTGPVNDVSAQLAVDRVRDAMLTTPNLWPTSFAWVVGGDVDVLEDTTGEVTDELAATQRTGAGASTNTYGPLPVGLLLKSRTNAFVSGRRLVGRTYFVPIQAALTAAASVSGGLQGDVTAIGDALLDAGTTTVFPVVWNRPRPATAVGPHRPAGPARAERSGSSAPVVSYSCSSKYVVLTSRRD